MKNKLTVDKLPELEMKLIKWSYINGNDSISYFDNDYYGGFMVIKDQKFVSVLGDNHVNYFRIFEEQIVVPEGWGEHKRYKTINYEVVDCPSLTIESLLITVEEIKGTVKSEAQLKERIKKEALLKYPEASEELRPQLKDCSSQIDYITKIEAFNEHQNKYDTYIRKEERKIIPLFLPMIRYIEYSISKYAEIEKKEDEYYLDNITFLYPSR